MNLMVNVRITKTSVDILIWENVDLCFRQKYTLTSRLGGGGREGQEEGVKI